MSWKSKLLRGAGAALTWLCGLLPALCCLLVHAGLALSFRYPRYDAELLKADAVLTLIALVPTVIFVVCWLAYFRRGRGQVLRGFLAVLCVLYLPLSLAAQALVSFACPFYSETARPAHYMQLDDLGDYGMQLMYGLFPEEAPAPLSDYYYRFVTCIDMNCEVYAECTLAPETLERERERVAALFAAQDEYWTVETAQRGAFTCMICYTEQHPFTLAGNHQYYTHAIFAYDEASGTVRYIFNDGIDVPEEYLPRCFALPW